MKKGAEEKRKEDISKTGWKLLFMADTKCNTKKDYLSDDYAGTNNGNLQEALPNVVNGDCVVNKEKQ